MKKPRPSNHLPGWYVLLMLAWTVFLIAGFAGLWPQWLQTLFTWLAALSLAAIMGMAVVLGLALAFILIVRPRRR